MRSIGLIISHKENEFRRVIIPEDIKRMKNGGMLFVEEGIIHYVVDHTPSIFYKTFSINNSRTIYPYLDELIEGKEGPVLKKAKIIEDGQILDKEILDFQER